MAYERRGLALAAAAVLALASSGCRLSGPAEGATLVAQDGADRAAPVAPDALTAAIGLPADAYRAARYDAKLGAVVLSGLRWETGAFVLSAGEAEVYGAAPSVLAALREGRAPAALTLAAERIELRDLRVAGASPGVALTAAEARLDGLRVREGPAAEAGDAPAEIARALSSFAFDAMSMSGVAVETSEVGDDPNAETPRPVTPLAAASVSVDGYRAGVLGRLVAEGTELDVGKRGAGLGAVLPGLDRMAPDASLIAALLSPQADRLSAERLVLEGADLSRLLPLVARGNAPPTGADDLLVVGALTIEGVTARTGERVLSTTERVSLAAPSFAGVVPTRLDLRTVGVTTDVSAGLPAPSSPGEGDRLAALREVLTRRGLDAVKSGSRVSYAFDPDAYTVEVRARGAADGLYASALDLSLEDADPGAFLGLTARDGTPRLGTFVLTLRDEALLEAGFDVAGVLGDRDPDLLRQQAIGLVTLGAMRGQEVSPRLPDYAAALAAFLSEGGTLRVEARPEEAVPLTAPMGGRGPSELIEALDLSVTQAD